MGAGARGEIFLLDLLSNRFGILKFLVLGLRVYKVSESEMESVLQKRSIAKGAEEFLRFNG